MMLAICAYSCSFPRESANSGAYQLSCQLSESSCQLQAVAHIVHQQRKNPLGIARGSGIKSHHRTRWCRLTRCWLQQKKSCQWSNNSIVCHIEYIQFVWTRIPSVAKRPVPIPHKPWPPTIHGTCGLASALPTDTIEKQRVRLVLRSLSRKSLTCICMWLWQRRRIGLFEKIKRLWSPHRRVGFLHTRGEGSHKHSRQTWFCQLWSWEYSTVCA